MPLPKFVLYTGIGAAAWCTILTFIGYFLGQHEGVLRNADIHRYVTWVLLALIPITLIAVLIYVRRRRSRGAIPS